MTSSRSFLFVYGTLLRAYKHPIHQVIAQHSRYIGTGQVQGCLYRISYYPGLVLSNEPSHWVHGELYELHDTNDVWTVLDEYEGYMPHNEAQSDYLRREVTVLCAAGLTYLAYTYVYNQPVEGFDLIPSGDFLLA